MSAEPETQPQLCSAGLESRLGERVSYQSLANEGPVRAEFRLARCEP